MSPGAEAVSASPMHPSTKWMDVWNQGLLSGSFSEGSSIVEGLQNLVPRQSQVRSTEEVQLGAGLLGL